MKKNWILAAFLSFFCSFGFATEAPLSGANPSLAPILKKVMPAVVNIRVTGEIPVVIDPFGDLRNRDEGPQQQVPAQQKFESLASGVIVDEKKGYILTNAHVVNKAKAITITLKDGRHFDAKLIGMDIPSDIAVIQIKASQLHSIELGDSNLLEVGDYVVAIGNPFGLDQTVTSGIISALKRNNLGIEGFENFIQTDAPINPGNSGGALVDMKGKLIGVNTAIFSTEGGSIGIGFAIPSDMAKAVMDQLIKYGSVKRGLIGLYVQNLTPELAKSFNQPEFQSAVVVTQVAPNSPSAKAGIQVGDVIRKINGVDITDAGLLKNTVGLVRAGTEITIELLRENKPMHLSLQSIEAQKYQDELAERAPLLFGVSMRDFAQESPAHEYVQGVEVLRVMEDTPAWRAELMPHDIIISANRQPVPTVKALTQIVDESKGDLLLNVLRQQGAVFILIKRT